MWIRLHPLYGRFNDFPGILVGVAWESCGVTSIHQCQRTLHFTILLLLSNTYVVLSMIFICSEFYVWTFAYDVSGINSIMFHYRKDLDGENPIDDYANEVYQSSELYNKL